MSKIAIDVVLIPEQKMIEQAMRLNRELLQKYPKEIILGSQINMPHISLCMGGIVKDELPQIIKCIEIISNIFAPINFQGKISIQEAPDRDSITWLELDKNDTIQQLQKVIMEDLSNYLNYDIEKYMFADAHEIEDQTVLYVKHYSKFYKNPSLFRPHITLGVGSLVKNNKSFSFSSSELAIFRLGSHCTCREFLYKTNLK